MNKLLIKDIKHGVTEGGISCGPVSGNRVTSIKYEENQKIKYFSLVDVYDTPNFYLSEKDIFNDLILEDFENEDFTNYMHSRELSKFGGINLEEFGEIKNDLNGKCETPEQKLLKLIIIFNDMNQDDCEDFILTVINKEISEIELDNFEDIIDIY